MWFTFAPWVQWFLVLLSRVLWLSLCLPHQLVIIRIILSILKALIKYLVSIWYSFPEPISWIHFLVCIYSSGFLNTELFRSNVQFVPCLKQHWKSTKSQASCLYGSLCLWGFQSPSSYSKVPHTTTHSLPHQWHWILATVVPESRQKEGLLQEGAIVVVWATAHQICL